MSRYNKARPTCKTDRDHDWRPAHAGPANARLYECANCGATEERDRT